MADPHDSDHERTIPPSNGGPVVPPNDHLANALAMDDDVLPRRASHTSAGSSSRAISQRTTVDDNRIVFEGRPWASQSAVTPIDSVFHDNISVMLHNVTAMPHESFFNSESLHTETSTETGSSVPLEISRPHSDTVQTLRQQSGTAFPELRLTEAYHSEARDRNVGTNGVSDGPVHTDAPHHHPPSTSRYSRMFGGPSSATINVVPGSRDNHSSHPHMARVGPDHTTHRNAPWVVAALKENTIYYLLTSHFDTRPFPPHKQISPDERELLRYMKTKEKVLRFYENATRTKWGLITVSVESVIILLLIVETFLFTVPSIYEDNGLLVAFDLVELALQTYLLVVVFLEVALRFWAADWYPMYRSPPLYARFRYLLTPWMIFNQFCILFNAILICVIVIQYQADLSNTDSSVQKKTILQLARIFQLIRIFRIPIFTHAMKVLFYNFKGHMATFALVGALAMMCILVFSIFFYIAEYGTNAEVTSLPVSLYWAIITTATVGYGDIVPITAWGRFVASLACWLAVPMFAAIIGIFSTSVALNFQNWESSAKLEVKTRRQAARVIQWWWRFRALQARSQAVIQWIDRIAEELRRRMSVKDHTSDVDIVFDTAVDPNGSQMFVGRVADNHSGDSIARLHSNASFSRRHASLVSLTSHTDDHTYEVLAPAEMKRSRVITILLLFKLFRDWHLTYLKELQRLHVQITLYHINRESRRMLSRFENFGHLTYLRHKAMVNDQYATKDALATAFKRQEDLMRKIADMQKQLAVTQASIATIMNQRLNSNIPVSTYSENTSNHAPARVLSPPIIRRVSAGTVGSIPEVYESVDSITVPLPRSPRISPSGPPDPTHLLVPSSPGIDRHNVYPHLQ